MNLKTKSAYRVVINEGAIRHFGCCQLTSSKPIECSWYECYIHHGPA